MIKTKLKNVYLYYSKDVRYLGHLTPGFQISGCIFLIFLYLTRRMILFSIDYRTGKYRSSTQALQISDTLIWLGTCSKITLTIHTKELDGKYKNFLPRFINKKKKNGMLSYIFYELFSFLQIRGLHTRKQHMHPKPIIYMYACVCI